MPTAIRTWSGQKLEPYRYPEDVRTMVAQLKPAGAGTVTELAKGTILGKVSATGKLAAYATGNADGTETALAILPYDVTVDENGAITLSSTADRVGGEWGETLNNIEVYIEGCFAQADLVGLDAGAVGDLGAKILAGTVAGSNAVIKF